MPTLGLQSQGARNTDHACTEHRDMSTGFFKIHVLILLEITGVNTK
jgi:hypothetical protein